MHLKVFSRLLVELHAGCHMYSMTTVRHCRYVGAVVTFFIMSCGWGLNFLESEFSGCVVWNFWVLDRGSVSGPVLSQAVIRLCSLKLSPIVKF